MAPADEPKKVKYRVVDEKKYLRDKDTFGNEVKSLLPWAMVVILVAGIVMIIVGLTVVNSPGALSSVITGAELWQIGSILALVGVVSLVLLLYLRRSLR